MRRGSIHSLLRFGAILAFAAALGACTKGGQFDPTTLLDNDMFDNKKPLQGQRESVFPNGVPGATSGIPADLYKGYQPPPEQAADTAGAATPITPAAAQPPKPVAKLEPKRKPKPKVARAPEPPRTEISIGLPKKPKPAGQQEAQPVQPTQTAWPQPAAAAARTDWPSPTAQTQPAQTNWPSPTAAPQQAAQPSQSIWPNPTTTGAQ